MAPDPTIKITDDLEKLIEILPPKIQSALKECGVSPSGATDDLLEVVLDLGRLPEARFPGRFVFLSQENVGKEEILYVVERIGKFGKDNRAGIARTLHRISAIRNRAGEIVGLTCRVGRAVYGTINIIGDVVELGQSILFLGRPGVGKTTMLREVARVLNDEFRKRVVIVDTSNEIAGDGDIPHPGIGRARRMQVPSPENQHAVMIEAVENHMPEVIVVDEIGTEAEAFAARTIAERGVQLVATAHGNTLDNLLVNPTLCDLIGGIQAVTLSDEEARRRGTQKTVLERKSPPTFQIVIEIQEINKLVIHQDVEKVIDVLLRGTPPQPEVRVRDEEGRTRVVQTSNLDELTAHTETSLRMPYDFTAEMQREKPTKVLKLFPYAVSRNRLERAVSSLRVSAQVVNNWNEADAVLTLKAQERKQYRKFRELESRNIPVYSVRSNTITQIQHALREVFHLPAVDVEELALHETEEAIKDLLMKSKAVVELAPQTTRIRRLQHQMAEKYNLKSRSTGAEPHRRVAIYRD